MKVKTTKVETVEIELPQYFELYKSYYKMIINDVALRVTPIDFSLTIRNFPDIVTQSIGHISNHLDRINPISKESFDLAYLKAEKILNELRK